jgi:hypothetical protein
MKELNVFCCPLQLNMLIVQANVTLRTAVTPKIKSRILSPRHFPCKVAIVLIKMNECTWIISSFILFPNSCEHKDWMCFSCDRKKKGFEPGLLFGNSERITNFEKTDVILCLIATGLVVQSKYAFYNLVPTILSKKLQNKNVRLS